MLAAVEAWTCCLRPRLKDFLSLSGVKLNKGVRVLAGDPSKGRALAAPTTAPCLLPQLLCHAAGWRQGTESGLWVFPWSCGLDPANVWGMLHFIGVALNDRLAINQLYRGARASRTPRGRAGAVGRRDGASLLCTNLSDAENTPGNVLSSGNAHSRENQAAFEATVPPLFPLRNFACIFRATKGL